VWYPDNVIPVPANPYAAVAKADGSALADDEVSSTVLLSYSRNGDEDDWENATASGFRLAQVDGKGVIQTQLGNWQDLTDGKTLNVTDFSVTMNLQPIRLACAKPCPDGTEACWPVIEVRNITIDITGQAAHDSSVERSLRSNVRLRNDAVVAGTCPA
jgi:prepilin peptidase dependent protein B